MSTVLARRVAAAVLLAALLAGCSGGAITPPGEPAAPAGPVPAGGLPRRDLTPGGVNPKVTQANIQQTICVPGWSSKQRPSRSRSATLKKRVMRLYGITRPASAYEGDHLIPISLGGDPQGNGRTENYWPEPWDGPYGAHVKDRFESWAHKAVCDGRMTLAEAQREFASNWYAGWVKAGKPGSSGGGSD